MGNKIYIQNQSTENFKFKRLYKKVFKTTLVHLNITEKTEANVIILDNKGIKAISKKYKKVDKATDVLSFPADWKELNKVIGYNMLGDIFISYEKINVQAEKFGHSLKREWAYIFVHGLLHLIGYDHKTKKTETEMNELAKIILMEVGVERNA